MTLKRLLIIAFACAGLTSMAEERPKLVVGIVVDQMRWDYLERFADRFGEGGFRRMLTEGYSCDNTLIDYIPTVTAIGHTSIYTGSVPSIHGIAGNNFRDNGRWVYCTDDETVKPVGSTSKAGLMSPSRLLTTTVGDELHLATNFRSRVIAVALKDRAAILPGGRTADGAYWFDDETGRFITSSYYRDELPEWLTDFNAKDRARTLLANDWASLYPIETYRQSTADNTPFEDKFEGTDTPTLPVPTSRLFKKQGYEVIRTTPYGNTLTLEAAKAAIEGEQLGRHDDTDFLAVSLSSTDYIGHQYGPNAIEVEDTYLRLDRDLAAFLTYLDGQVGRGNYLIFLTADHAAAHNPTFMRAHKMSAGGWDTKAVLTRLDSVARADFGIEQSVIERIENYQVFLDQKQIAARHIDRQRLAAAFTAELERLPEVAYAVCQRHAASAAIPAPIRERIVNGFNHQRSGEIQIILKPGYYDDNADAPTGTQHGVWCNYDAHIPLVFMGWNVPAGRTTRPTHMTDIAATVAAMLHIQQPSGCIGNPIEME